MTYYSTIALIMGAIMIFTLVLYARTKRTRSNNLFNLFLLAVLAIAATVYASVHPNWWTLAILAALMFIFRIALHDKRKKLVKENKIRCRPIKPSLLITNSILIAGVLVATSILLLRDGLPWYGVSVWVIGGLMGLYILGVLLKVWLDEI